MSESLHWLHSVQEQENDAGKPKHYFHRRLERVESFFVLALPVYVFTFTTRKFLLRVRLLAHLAPLLLYPTNHSHLTTPSTTHLLSSFFLYGIRGRESSTPRPFLRLLMSSKDPLLSAAAARFIVHHVVLPPKLPRESDRDTQNERALLDLTAHALEEFSLTLDPHHARTVNDVRSTILNLALIRNKHRSTDEAALLRAIKDLGTRTGTAEGGAIPVEVEVQNAGILISKSGDNIAFESFELSPLNKCIMTSQGRLRRTFPASLVHIKVERYNEEALQGTIAQTISRMSSEIAEGSQPTARKAGREHNEIRDTSDPSLVTDLLMNILAAVGEPASPLQVTKNTREDVLYEDARLPWRRSPLWLLVKVSMQLSFTRLNSTDENLYKNFMLFFLSKVLDAACRNLSHLGGDMVLAITAKISRRLLKSGRTLQAPHAYVKWLQAVHSSMRTAQVVMDEDWEIIRMKDHRQLIPGPKTLRSLRPDREINVCLPELDRYIAGMARRKHYSVKPTDFCPKDEYPHFPAHQIPTNLRSYSTKSPFKLVAFEFWVAEHLEIWLSSHVAVQTTVGLLRNVAEVYHSIAIELYQDDPRALSIYYLTIMELWVAGDKSACHVHPLLQRYDPEIPVSPLQGLLLPLKGHLQRLQKIETYIAGRRKNAVHHKISVYRHFGHPSSFAVQFFDRSTTHQALLCKIETNAKEQRSQKREELSRAQAKGRKLTEEHSKMVCEVFTYRYRGHEEERHDSNRCKKCRKLQEIAKITIAIHEWPVSSNPSRAKATVFELDVPVAFSDWRDMSIFLILEVLGCEYRHESKPRCKQTLSVDKGLRSYIKKQPSLIIPLSQDKAHAVTHRAERRGSEVLNLRDSDVCLATGLRYEYYDTVDNVFTADFKITDLISTQCMIKLPAKSAQLQNFLARTSSAPDGKSPNEVLASQSRSPSAISLSEWKALASLPCGVNIQYHNLLTQLAIPSLDWAKVETQIFVLQIALQANRPSSAGSVERAAHQICLDDTFAKGFISQLNLALDRIEDNWESWRALSSFVQLALRLASLSRSSNIVQLCASLLEKSREICMVWINKLQTNAQTAIDDGQRSFFSSRACEIALVAIATFETEPTLLETVLSSTQAASVFLRCSMTVQEYKDATTSEHPCLHQSQLEAWRHLMYRAFPILKSKCCTSSCLDDAISGYWSAFRPGANWQPYKLSKGEHWLSTETQPLATSTPITAHFNLLTSEFLINGLPVGKLPSEFTSTASYQQLLQQKCLEVVPTNVPGFKFETKHDYRGQILRFGLVGEELLIQATSLGDPGQMVEVLPLAIFKTELPTSFVEGCVHWYDPEKKEVEFCDLDNPWGLNDVAHWRLQKVGTEWRLRKGGLSLLSLSTQTAQELSRPFTTLEHGDHIHVLFKHTEGVVEVSLPRLQLDFQLQLGDVRIVSRQYRGMALALVQSTGTLFGLSSKLVLEPGDIQDRIVLIPEGTVEYRKAADHVAISVTPGTGKRVHAYTLDTILGSLRDNGSLQSRLYLCYLHALTSHCLPDPLCGRTGTEMALDILRSGATRSFTKLAPENISLLEKISKLTPKRSYYPKNERVMQTVQFDQKLRSFAQHPLFYTLVGEIFEQARRSKMFFKSAENWVEPPDLKGVHSFLLRRDMIRSSTFRVAGYGGEDFSAEYDTPYKGRDTMEDKERGGRAYTTAKLVLKPTAALHSPLPTTFHETLWHNYLSASTVQGPIYEPLESKRISFGANWLHDPTTFLPELWCQLHESFSRRPETYNRYDVMMFLSTMAFSTHADMGIIQTLMILYRRPAVSTYDMPRVRGLHLNLGHAADKSVLLTHVNYGRCHYETWENNSITPRKQESLKSFRKRRKQAFEDQQSTVIDGFIKALLRQWPCEVPTTPETDPTFLNSAKAMESVRPMFKAWLENDLFYRYLERLATAVRQQPVEAVRVPAQCLPKATLALMSQSRFINTEVLFSSVVPPSLPPSPQPPAIQMAISKEVAVNVGSQDRLQGLCDDLLSLQRTRSEEMYVKHLAKSFAALNNRQRQSPGALTGIAALEALKDYLSKCHDHLAALDKLFSAVLAVKYTDSEKSDADSSFGPTAQYQFLPRICASLYIKQLKQTEWVKLPDEWKFAVTRYALAVSDLQRAKRMLLKSGSDADLAEELINSGHTNWSPADFPETLLMELESNILVRPVQEEIAKEMRNPSHDNAGVMMQLNMGEGKSSTIVPMVAASLADTTQ